ncbi:BLUF domain-containing protein [Methylobacterium sp. P31]
MERSLLYVSRRLATADDVQDIVAISRDRNAQLQVTGALIASRSRFAQILEGQRSGVDALMDSIRRDGRHTDVEVLLYDDIERRRFPGWSLAYSGASTFVDGLIKALADRTSPQPDPHHLRRLIGVMQDFARDPR